MTIKQFILSSFLSCVLLEAENTIGININSNDLEVLTSVKLTNLTDYSNSTTYMIDASYIHTNTNNLTTVSISGVNTFQGVKGLSLAFGLKSIFASNFFALPLFAKGSLLMPFTDTIPATTLSTSYAYAPSVLTFRNGEKYTEFKVEADMEIISNIHIFTGYRNINTQYTTYEKLFNNSFYGGMKLSF